MDEINALILNCTLKKSPQESNTEALIDIVTGNEDGAHACAETTLFNMTHMGFTVPPNADTYWVGDAGPGPSFIEAGGADSAYTNKTAGWMAHNVVHMARILKQNPIPPEGNTVPGWMPHQSAGGGPAA